MRLTTTQTTAYVWACTLCLALICGWCVRGCVGSESVTFTEVEATNDS